MLSEPHDTMVHNWIDLKNIVEVSHDIHLMDHPTFDTIQHHIANADAHLERSVSFHNKKDYTSALSHMLVAESHLGTVGELLSSSSPSLKTNMRDYHNSTHDAVNSYSLQYLGGK